ncbi:MAG: 5-formyltetrahydrofolate cyclo-ligase [bacterium]
MADQKKKIRNDVSKALRGLTETEIIEKSKLISGRVKQLRVFKEAKNIVFYYSKYPEVSTHEFIKDSLDNGKTVFLPKIVENSKCFNVCSVSNCDTDLCVGKWGISEPKDKGSDIQALKIIDLIIVPGIAFDEYGNRIGRGQGYYDKVLSKLNNAPKVALAFDLQVRNIIPVDEHDIQVDYIITESRIIRSLKRR